jgi:phosphoribosylanthranilate isomerase
MTLVKICGVTSVDDARMCVDAGANAIGLNFVPESPRRVDVATARAIVEALAHRKVLLVGVVANLAVADATALRYAVGLRWLQLHGDETPGTLDALLPDAYKAIRVADASDVRHAHTYAGEHFLVDAKPPGGALGGTGARFDWSLVTELARARKVTLAGGLTPDNVAEAIQVVRPFCVDVASGVESSPGRKDEAMVRAFVKSASSLR